MIDCILCGQTSSQTIIENTLSFCCAGCRTVYYLIEAKFPGADKTNHPLFHQAVKSGLISNARLLEQIGEKESAFSETKRMHLEIHDMWCPSCAEVIHFMLGLEKGVVKSLIDYATDMAMIEYAPSAISEEKILRLIADWGYEPKRLEDAIGAPISFILKLRFIVAAFFSMNIMMFAYPVYWHPDNEYQYLFSWISLILSVPIVTFSAAPIYKRFYNSFRFGVFGMETLIMIGIVSSLSLSVFNLVRNTNEVYFDSLSVIIAFVLLGKIIESKLKYSAKMAFFHLQKWLPQKARRQNGQIALVKELQKNDCLMALAGEKIVLDGIVTEGEGLVNEASMTGESCPLLKTAGSELIAGTVLEKGRLIYAVNEDPSSSRLQQMIHVCHANLEQKSAYVRTMDPLIRWFVPLVLAISFLGWFVEGASSSLAVLLISCPCAIGIAIPMAESAIIFHLATKGVLIRNKGVLQSLPKISLFALDKTGTLTEGKIRVVKGGEGLPNHEQTILKGLSRLSIHPVSKAIYQYLSGDEAPIDHFQENQGEGILAEVDGAIYKLGSGAFVGSDESNPNASVYFSKNNAILAQFELDDALRKNLDFIKTLPSVLLSGDKESVVKKVAESIPIRHYHAHLKPFEKKTFIHERQKEKETVLFIGDGLNDAPALTQANVGIAMASGTDFSHAASDVIFTKDDLSLLPLLIKTGKFGQKIIYQNLFWAFIYNIFGISLAFFGYLTPLYSSLAMIFSSASVMLNTLRIRSR